MKDNYDFSQGKRGAVVPMEPHQIRITLSLDKDIIDWFRSKVHESGGGDYHELINQALQQYIKYEQSLLTSSPKK
jgi:uncharacterized protein (DUF4415 family)